MRKGLSFSDAGKLGYEKSRAKREAQQAKIREQYALNPTTCQTCGINFPYEKRNNKYCNHSCAASNTNLGKPKHFKYVLKPCIYCDTITKNPKYCSAKCKTDYEWHQKKQKIEETQAVETIKQARRYLREVQGTVCKICGNKKWMGKAIPLTLDHIDGNSDNWKLDNLRLICPNCDAQTPTYKGKNRGNGRHYRRQRYAEGKSY